MTRADQLEGATVPSSRPSIPEATKIRVWAKAAGRCTLCNTLVTENDSLGEAVPIGELAHNVGWGDSSPRGASELTTAERAEAENLLLLCRNCHKPIDASGAIGRYSIEELARFKREHEKRIEMLTAVGADRQAALVRVVGTIRGAQPELTYDTALGALVRSGNFPSMLPNAYRSAYELDLTSISGPYTVADFAECARQIDALAVRINDGVRLGGVARLAVFGFARIPVLVHLGARLDDKVPAMVFQRQRSDTDNAWSWPATSESVDFDLAKVQEGTTAENVALVLSLSGTIAVEELPAECQATYSIYVITPRLPATPGPSLIQSPATLDNFGRAMREFFAAVEADHGKIARVDVFPAAPVSAAITVGRAMMPNVSPILRVFDRGEDGEFFEAIEVAR